MELHRERAAMLSVFILPVPRCPVMVSLQILMIISKYIYINHFSESSSSRVSAITVVLPWGAQKETVKPQQIGDMDLRPGEYVMRILFAEFTSQAEKKMEAVMTEHVSDY